MVALPRLHAPHSLAMDFILSADKANTSRARDAGLHRRGVVSGAHNSFGAGDNDSRNAGELSFGLGFLVEGNRAGSLCKETRLLEASMLTFPTDIQTYPFLQPPASTDHLELGL